MTDKSRKILFVVFLPQEWEIYHRRPYWEAMAKHAEILIIEPPLGLLTAWLRPKRLKDIFRGLKQPSDFQHNVYYYRPYQLMTPGFNFIFSLFSRLDKLLMRRQLNSIIKGLGTSFDKIALFIVHVYQQHFSGILPNAVQCFEITDLYLIPHGRQNLDDTHWYTKKARRYESKIVDESTLVMTSSGLIYERLKKTQASVHYLPNAADYHHFSKSRDESLAVPDDIAGLPSPRMGFIGYINHLIDFELIAKLAKNFPESSLIMIGGVQSISKVSDDLLYNATLQISNVHYRGFKKYETLPAYLKGFDICLMPFRLNDWMKHSAPNKTYQYLASGKPIVSTDFTEIRRYADIVRVGKSHDEFIKLVGEAISERDGQLVQKRLTTAMENSTENRAKKLFELISKTTG
jgi:glycosyltransferase involved in cell wall biosynthesis